MPTEEEAPLCIRADSEEYVDVETKKNKKDIRCQLCNSKVLSKGSCTFIDKEFALPYMKSKDKDGNTLNDKRELINNYWLVIDMMTFDNVGFLKTVDGLKYLICADCEVGPIGYQNVVEDMKRLYVAPNRVKYQ